jgi:hypothetical protein
MARDEFEDKAAELGREIKAENNADAASSRTARAAEIAAAEEEERRRASRGSGSANPTHAQLGANIRPDIVSAPGGLETITTQKSANHRPKDERRDYVRERLAGAERRAQQNEAPPTAPDPATDYVKSRIAKPAQSGAKVPPGQIRREGLAGEIAAHQHAARMAPPGEEGFLHAVQAVVKAEQIRDPSLPPHPAAPSAERAAHMATLQQCVPTASVHDALKAEFYASIETDAARPLNAALHALLPDAPNMPYPYPATFERAIEQIERGWTARDAIESDMANLPSPDYPGAVAARAVFDEQCAPSASSIDLLKARIEQAEQHDAALDVLREIDPNEDVSHALHVELEYHYEWDDDGETPLSDALKLLWQPHEEQWAHDHGGALYPETVGKLLAVIQSDEHVLSQQHADTLLAQRAVDAARDHLLGTAFLDALAAKIKDSPAFEAADLRGFQESLGDTHPEAGGDEHPAALGRDIRLNEGFMRWDHRRESISGLIETAFERETDPVLLRQAEESTKRQQVERAAESGEATPVKWTPDLGPAVKV